MIDETEQFLQTLNEFAQAFEVVRDGIRVEDGSKQLAFAFLENDVITDMCETLARLANYCQDQFIKLMILQRVLEEELTTSLPNEGRDIITSLGKFTPTRGQ